MITLETFVAAILLIAIIALVLLYRRRYILGVLLLALLVVFITVLFNTQNENLATFLIIGMYLLAIVAVVSLFVHIPIIESKPVKFSNE